MSPTRTLGEFNTLLAQNRWVIPYLQGKQFAKAGSQENRVVGLFNAFGQAFLQEQFIVINAQAADLPETTLLGPASTRALEALEEALEEGF
mgnify:FL=1